MFKYGDVADRDLAAWGSTDAPGCAVAAIRGKETIYRSAVGAANLAYSVPITTATTFYAASLAKQFTGCCVELLRERGRLDLGDPAHRILPELPPCAKDVTLDHLLHHTSGLPDYVQLLFAIGIRDDRDLDRFMDEDALRILSRVSALRFLPGTACEYTNSGYFLLARVVERISDCPFREFVRREILEPLGMHRTRFLESPREIVEQLAVGYQRQSDGSFREHTTANSISGASGLVTTIDDLCRWASNLACNTLGSGSQGLVEAMFQTSVLKDGSPCGYGAGFQLGERQGTRHLSHSGKLANTTSVLHHFPESGLSVVGFSNRDGIDMVALALEIADAIREERPPCLPFESSAGVSAAGRIVNASSSLAQRVAGIYRSCRTRLVVTLEERDGDLVFYAPDKPCVKDVFRPMGDNRMRLVSRGTSEITPSQEIEFVFGEGDPDAVDLYFVYSPETRSRYSRFTPSPLNTALLSDYKGLYYCTELGVAIAIHASSDGVQMHLPTGKPVDLFYVDADEFLKGYEWIDFHRDEAGTVSEFAIHDFNGRTDPRKACGPVFRRVPAFHNVK